MNAESSELQDLYGSEEKNWLQENAISRVQQAVDSVLRQHSLQNHRANKLTQTIKLKHDSSLKSAELGPKLPASDMRSIHEYPCHVQVSVESQAPHARYTVMKNHFNRSYHTWALKPVQLVRKLLL